MSLEHSPNRDGGHIKVAYSIDDAANVSGIGRTKLYAEIKAGRLQTRKCGSRTIVLATDLQHWLSNLPNPSQSK